MTSRAPNSPKIAPDAPTTWVGNDRSATATEPPSVLSRYSVRNRQRPRRGSRLRPISHSASMFSPMCQKLECTSATVRTVQGWNGTGSVG